MRTCCRAVNGFVGEGVVALDAADITRFGGWRNYLSGRANVRS